MILSLDSPPGGEGKMFLTTQACVKKARICNFEIQAACFFTKNILNNEIGGIMQHTYFATPGLMTDAKEKSKILMELPDDIPSIVKTIQGSMVHIFWADYLGLKLPEERKKEVGIRSISQKLDKLFSLDSSPLEQSRPLERRLVGNCRDFSLFFSSILRAKGIPVRSRCGFAVYFKPGNYEDHWVNEYWDKEKQAWIMVDSQLDDIQQERLRIDFNPLNMPPGKFLNGSEAWELCTKGNANPEKFGIFEYHGLAFIRGDLIRDLLSFSKIEMLAWDMWGIIQVPPHMSEKQHIKEYQQLIDQVVFLIKSPEDNMLKLQELYKLPEFQIPLEIYNSPDLHFPQELITL